MKNPRDILGKFLAENMQWMIASLVLAFGLWIIAVLQSDPVQEREYPRQQTIEFLLDENTIITDGLDTESALVTLRAPRSVWDVLRSDQINVFADLRGREPGIQRVELQAELADDLRGQVVDISPREVQVTLEELASKRVPIRTIVTQEPPSGYSYPVPTCSLAEVTARGPAVALEGIMAVARLNLSEERNPVTLTVNLLVSNEAGRIVSGVTLEPNQVDCQIEISQREGVSELSVVPIVDGFPPDGYIYEGYDFEPKTVVVTGQTEAIRGLNGVVKTEPIDLTGATSNFERTVSVELPVGVRLLPETQTINVSVTIGTIPSSSQYDGVPIQVEGLNPGMEVQLLPNIVTVFVVGPQPTLESLNENDLRVVVNLEGFEGGTYQVTAQASIIVEDLRANTTVTVQPPEISVSITPNETLETPGIPTP